MPGRGRGDGEGGEGKRAAIGLEPSRGEGGETRLDFVRLLEK